jgi:phosphoribosylaminoimidazole-succinocarboxamide synthase
MGKPGQQMPSMPDDFVNLVTERYIELYEKITGRTFERVPLEGMKDRIEQNVLKALS